MSAERDRHYRDASKGAVYTPMSEARRCVAALPNVNGTIFDPACGNGNLLIAAAERKLAEGQQPEQIAADLFGNDINAEAVAEAAARLNELLGVAAPAENFTIGDWLNES